MKTYEKQLPEGYVPCLTIDAASKKDGLKLNIIAAVLTVIGLATVALTSNVRETVSALRPAAIIGCVAAYFGVFFVYLALHELTHGAVYHLRTHEKLVFGFKKTVAYCGVPNIYVYRKTALMSLLAPFVIFGIVFGILSVTLSGMPALMARILLAAHIGGCGGDLYDTWIFATRLRDNSILMHDGGPKQVFYKKA